MRFLVLSLWAAMACASPAAVLPDAADNRTPSSPAAVSPDAADNRTPSSSATIDRWAVLVAGSNSFGNYRHQADVCHAQTQLVANGVPRRNIITMVFDDIAGSSDNAFPGQVFNAPADGLGADVYPGCVDERSYTGENVTAANFLAVITGNASAATGAVLGSSSRSHVLIAFFDHGAGGLVCFPTGDMLYADQFAAALDTMHTKRVYERLVLYIEACESGSVRARRSAPLRATPLIALNTHSLPTASPADVPEPSEQYACVRDDRRKRGRVQLGYILPARL